MKLTNAFLKKMLLSTFALLLCLSFMPMQSQQLYAAEFIYYSPSTNGPWYLNSSNGVVANYDANNAVLVVSGNGAIERSKWFAMVDQIVPGGNDGDRWGRGAVDIYCEDFSIQFKKNNPGDKIVFPVDSSRLFCDFHGQIDFGPTDLIDTSNVTDMSNLFNSTYNFDQSINHFDTSNVTTMRGMFFDARVFDNGGQTLSLNTAKVTDMSYMFYNTTAFNREFDCGVGHFDTSKVTTMEKMFCDTFWFNQSINGFKLDAVTNMAGMFEGATFYNNGGEVLSINAPNLAYIGGMFSSAKDFNQPINFTGSNNIVNISNMFWQAQSFNQSINSWPLVNVKNAAFVFSSANKYNNGGETLILNLPNLKDGRGIFKSSLLSENCELYLANNVAEEVDLTECFRGLQDLKNIKLFVNNTAGADATDAFDGCTGLREMVIDSLKNASILGFSDDYEVYEVLGMIENLVATKSKTEPYSFTDKKAYHVVGVHNSTTYTISYDGNSADSGAVADGSKNHGENYTIADAGNLVKAGHTFDGWNTAADGSGSDYAAGSVYTDDADLSLYAQWTPVEYTITYLDNGADSGVVPDGIKQHGVSYTISGVGDLVKAGHTFDGWNTAADGGGSDYAAGSVYTDDADLELYAQWTPVEYTITYLDNGADSGFVPNGIKQYGVSYTIAGVGDLVKAGHTFDGWNTAADGSGTDYIVGNIYTDDADLELYAQWKPDEYTITYLDNGADSGAVPNGTKQHDVDYTVVGAGNLVKAGYVFIGWNITADGSGKDIAVGSVYQGNEDLTLYAQWSPIEYIITYQGNGADSGAVPNGIKQHGVSYTISGVGDLVKEGHTFDGWNTAADGGGSDYAAGSVYTDDADLTLYAEWQAVSQIGVPTVSLSKAGSAIKVTWTAVPNATGYQVYRADKNSGSFKKFKTTSLLKYTNSGALVPGMPYYYKVRAYKKNGSQYQFGDFSDVKGYYAPGDLATPAKPSLTLDQNGNGIRLNWNEQDRITGYQVYRGLSPDKPFSYLKTASGAATVYTNLSGLTQGRPYYYKIRAYRMAKGQREYGEFSDIKGMFAGTAEEALDAVDFSLEDNPGVTAPNVRVRWQKVTGADGYCVYRWNSANQSWTGLKKTGPNATVYTNINGVVNGKTHFYAMRPYHISGGKTYYGNIGQSKGFKVMKN